MRLWVGVWICAAVLVSACSPGNYKLREFVSDGTPEEFSIQPVKPLTLPENLSALPAPTPGQANLTDPTPQADAVAALGGNPARLQLTGVPGSDAALVRQASRYGVPANVREIVASEDAEYLRRAKRFNYRLFRSDEYRKAYRRQALDPRAELFRLRRAGVRTPSAPPAN